MKAFYCTECNTFVVLQKTNMMHCFCKQSFGRYFENNLDAEMGGLAVPFGISSYVLYSLVKDENFIKVFGKVLEEHPEMKESYPIYWRKEYGKQPLGTGVITRISNANPT